MTAQQITTEKDGAAAPVACTLTSGGVHPRGPVRDVSRNFNASGFGSLFPKYKGGRPPKFTPAQRHEIK